MYNDTAQAHCYGDGAPAPEIAFLGTVVSQRLRPAEFWVIDNVTGESPRYADIESTTFEVGAWFTDDLGATIELWSPGFDGDVGSSWLVESSRYDVDGQAGGEVTWCRTVQAEAASVEEWTLRFNGSVRPGGSEPESPADPAVLAALEEGRSQWTERGRDMDLTVSIHVQEGHEQTLWIDAPCGAWVQRHARSNGVLLQAFDTLLHCPIESAETHSIDELYEKAIAAAGAVLRPPRIDAETGALLEFVARDRSVALSVQIEIEARTALPLVIDDVGPIDDRIAQWESLGWNNYDLTVTNGAHFCLWCGPGVVEVRGDSITRPEDYPTWLPATAEQIFQHVRDTVASGPDRVLIIYDKETGLPRRITVDHSTEIMDDELTLTFSAKLAEAG